MTTYRSILTPLDGSAFSEHALPMACQIALRDKAILRLVHVHALSSSPIYVEGHPVIDENMHSLYLEHEKLYLEQIKERLTTLRPGLQVEVEVYDRPIASLIGESVGTFLARRIAERDDVDLIVMTTHGHSGLTRFWLGSVADEMVRTSHIPVLLLQPTDQTIDYAHPPNLKRILVPLDSSSLSEQVLPVALALGKLIQAEEYTLLNIVQPFNFARLTSREPIGSFDMDPNHKMETQATNYLSSIAQRLQNGERRILTRVILAHNPASAILEDAQNQAIDLIVLATHARSGWTRFTIGSVADKVLRGATVPVLLFRPNEVT